MGPERVTASVLEKFFGRRIVTGKPEQIAHHPADLIAQASSPSDIKNHVRFRWQVAPCSFRYQIDTGCFGRTLPLASRHAGKIVTDPMWARPVHFDVSGYLAVSEMAAVLADILE